MDNVSISTNLPRTRSRAISTISCAILLITSCTAMFGETPKKDENSVPSSFSATHVLGLPNTALNISGSVQVQSGSLRFESKKQSEQVIPVTSIDAVLLSQQDKQVGGTPMMLGKVAAPYGGGRVVSLFAHKKYDDVSIVYRDEDGGVHGVIFQLSAGQGAELRDELVTQGARVGPEQSSTSGETNPEVSDAKN